jgi:hypothetical protein
MVVNYYMQNIIKIKKKHYKCILLLEARGQVITQLKLKVFIDTSSLPYTWERERESRETLWTYQLTTALGMVCSVTVDSSDRVCASASLYGADKPPGQSPVVCG